jgi:hypothetical protein
MQKQGEEKTKKPYLAIVIFISAFIIMLLAVVFKNKILAYFGYRYLVSH